MSFLSLRTASSTLPALLRSSLARGPHATPLSINARFLSTPTGPQDPPPVPAEAEQPKVPFYKRLFKRKEEVKVTDLSNEEMEEEYRLQEAYHEELEAARRRDEIRKKRNKSKLSASHRQMLRGKPPITGVEFELTDLHRTKAYKMGLMGTYGPKATGIRPSVAWPNELERYEAREYERVLYDGRDLKETIEFDRIEEAREKEEIRVR